ncbi:isopentenyl-diphosphate Delta-isomerase [Blattabacterium cuenoti]|uniref:isopentenyl-diphosphate Delta-isomerase n=1 Tax=Blattabacterium cuenoti TaxID=1653831 RepID=UPI00163D0C1F|nr:isopentenyl-diphosphate Delta-isomerase [Blattabacterium cuenoti]
MNKIDKKQKINNDLIPLIGKKKEIIGFEEKNTIHEKGILHSAVSVFIFNMKNDLMIQKRSFNKYHSSLLWTNTCCSHPKKHESLLDAAHRCLINEMGFDCFLKKKFCFIYNELLNNGLIENELDHVFVGYYEKNPNINYKEVNNWDWISVKKLIQNIQVNPKSYTIWLKIIINKYINKLLKK